MDFGIETRDVKLQFLGSITYSYSEVYFVMWIFL